MIGNGLQSRQGYSSLSPLGNKALLRLVDGLTVGDRPTPDVIAPVGLTDFKRRVYRAYQTAPHLDALDAALSQVSRYVATNGAEGIGRLIVEMPPRHGKSLTVSKLYPSWHIGNYPEHRFISVSYGQDLANKNSRFARNLIRSNAYRQLYPDVELASDSASVASWDTARYGGGMDAIGIGGGAAGKGAHVLCLDDLIKNRAEAESQTYRDRIWDSFLNDLYTRLEPGGAIVLMFTRWHTDDPIGRALALMADEHWHVLRLPAIAELNDPIGRVEGEALWSERYPIDRLHVIRDALGSYSFASLYQQSPLPSGGGLFKTERIEIIDHAPECKQVVRFYDLAVTAKRSADYTAGVKLGVMPDETLVILDLYHVQKEFTDVHEGIVQNAALDGQQVRFRLEAEKAGIIGLQYLLRDSRMRGYTFDTKAPEGDKYTRALPFAARVEAGKVKMVRGAWNRVLLDELAVFPSGGHDDIVDGLSGAHDMLSKPRASFETILQLNL